MKNICSSSDLNDTPAHRSYHHGDLRRVLLDTTVKLIEAEGLDAVSVREIAKLAGVSPGAPFRHFANKTALMTAVAEEAMDRLAAAIDLSLQSAVDEDPLMQFRAIGVAFLQWSFANPTHFQVISNREIIHFEGSTLRQRNDAIRLKMTSLMNVAAERGLLRAGDVARYQIAARALVYGIARIHIDGQFPSWELNEHSPLEESIAILDQFMTTIRRS